MMEMTMRKRIDNIVINYIDDELNEYECTGRSPSRGSGIVTVDAVRAAILTIFANPSREFTDAFLNAWVIGGFPCHAEVHNNYLRAEFAKAMAAAVDAINGEDAK